MSKAKSLPWRHLWPYGHLLAQLLRSCCAGPRRPPVAEAPASCAAWGASGGVRRGEWGVRDAVRGGGRGRSERRCARWGGGHGRRAQLPVSMGTVRVCVAPGVRSCLMSPVSDGSGGVPFLEPRSSRSMATSSLRVCRSRSRSVGRSGMSSLPPRNASAQDKAG
uniref:Uncharacterized protein n=1 Tax=Chrysotila carterae TaxID=13221 RepID=A0A7S4B4F4_CHRCT